MVSDIQEVSMNVEFVDADLELVRCKTILYYPWCSLKEYNTKNIYIIPAGNENIICKVFPV